MHPFDGLEDLVRPDAPLAPLVWFRLGGPAAYFAKPRTLDELVDRADAGLATRDRRSRSWAAARTSWSATTASTALVILLESPFFSDVTVRGQRRRGRHGGAR